MDLAGQKFGMLCVIKRTENTTGKKHWICRCDCGREKLANTHDLLSGRVKSCGCLRSKDLTGRQFGFLTVLETSNNRSNEGRKVWKCLCECGNVVEKDTKALLTGGVRSCGCKRAELHNQSDKCVKHGMYNTRLYRTWSAMRNRCSNSANHAYRYYGGRGITVCSEWEEFESFMEWAMENGYQENLTIDRINVDGNYEPDNCRWATLEIQANNKRTSKYIEFQGEKHTVSEWSRITGFSKELIAQRLKRGWTEEETLTIPPIPGGAIRHNGIKRPD